MPLFKRLTPEEKEAKRQEKIEKRIENIMIMSADNFEANILPKVKTENFKADLQAIEPELRMSDDRHNEAILSLEKLFIEGEKLYAYTSFVGAEENVHFSTAFGLLAVTNLRLFLLVEGRNVDSMTHNYLNAVDFEALFDMAGVLSISDGKQIMKLEGVASWVGDKIVEIIRTIKVAFDEQLAKEQSEAQEENAGAPVETEEVDVAAELSRLKQLLYSRVITDEEFETLKAKLIGS